MRTRIRTKEYNNGKVEYICEEDNFKKIAQSTLFLLIPYFYFSDNRWEIIGRKLNIDGEVEKYKTYGIFDTLDAAKGFIDGYIKECQEKKALADGNKIKKETFEKYP